MPTGYSWLRLHENTQRQQFREGIVAPDYPGPVASDWPDLLALVRQSVKPERDRQKRAANRERWWQYAEKRPGLTRAARKLSRVLAINCGATPHMAFTFLDSNVIFANTLAILTFDSFQIYCVLQSQLHEIWARFFGSSLEDRLRYTPTDCFETFALPAPTSGNNKLPETGEKYYEARAELMLARGEGLTKTYNRFHDPNETAPDIANLRVLHDEMDRAVLNAYGWTDIQPKCEFTPEFEDEEDQDDNGRPKKKKYRYRWPDEIRDEVLARLLELNRQRALEEGQMVTEEKSPKKQSAKKSAATTPLFEEKH